MAVGWSEFAKNSWRKSIREYEMKLRRLAKYEPTKATKERIQKTERKLSVCRAQLDWMENGPTRNLE